MIAIRRRNSTFVAPIHLSLLPECTTRLEKQRDDTDAAGQAFEKGANRDARSVSGDTALKRAANKGKTATATQVSGRA
jgi:hypothetical protein